MYLNGKAFESCTIISTFIYSFKIFMSLSSHILFMHPTHYLSMHIIMAHRERDVIARKCRKYENFHLFEYDAFAMQQHAQVFISYKSVWILLASYYVLILVAGWRKSIIQQNVDFIPYNHFCIPSLRFLDG